MVKAERLGQMRGFIGGLYGRSWQRFRRRQPVESQRRADLHAKRVDALAGATLGVMRGASLAVAMIGQALTQARGLVTKHAVKQVNRLLLVSAFAMALLSLLGAVGESLGMDRLLKSNTSKTRTHSLFRQGCMLYDLIPNMPEHRLAPLMAAFAQTLSQATTFSSLFAQAK